MDSNSSARIRGEEIRKDQDVNGTPSHVLSLKRALTDTFDELALIPGRRSFGGKNPHVERQFEEYLGVSSTKRRVIDENAILEQYEELIALPRGPDQGRLKPLRKRRNKDSKS